MEHGGEDKGSVRTKRGELLDRKSYETNKIIFRDGSPGVDAFVIQSGKVGLFKENDGKRVILTTLSKGAMFGEMAAITGSARTASAVALEPTILVRISATMIREKISNCDPFIKALIQILIGNVSRATKQVATKDAALDKALHSLEALSEMAKDDEESELIETGSSSNDAVQAQPAAESVEDIAAGIDTKTDTP